MRWQRALHTRSLSPAWLPVLVGGLVLACGPVVGPVETVDKAVGPATSAAPAPDGALMALVWLSSRGTERLRQPAGLAVDGQGDVIVADIGRDRLVRLDRHTGQVVASVGGTGSAAGQFRFAPPPATDPDERGHPLAGQLAVADGYVYVADGANHRVQVLNGDGRPRAIWTIPGSTPGTTKEPGGLAVAGQDAVYVVDRWSHQIHKMDRAGRLLLSWGGLGTTSGTFALPSAVAVDARGQVYVLDSGNYRVQVFDGDGRLQTAWGGLGSEPGEFTVPTGLTVDAGGRVYVADNGNSRIQVFTTNGIWLGAWGGPSVAPGRFVAISGIAVDDEGAIYVADSALGRVQKFRPRQPWPTVVGTPTPRPATPTVATPTPRVTLTPTDR